MLSKPVGQIRSVDFHWYLDTSHGTDYFRRWHGIKAKSGSLWVHKATHHFDYVNWLLDAEPVQVQAYGGIKRYGNAGPFRRTNCRPCTHKAECPFYWDMTKSASAMRALRRRGRESRRLPARRAACSGRRSPRTTR